MPTLCCSKQSLCDASVANTSGKFLFFSSPKRLDRLCDPHKLQVCVNRRFLLAGAQAAVKRITDLHIVSMLRMRGAIPLVHHKRSCKILGSHSGNYEDSCLPGCDTMTSDTQTFRGNLILKMGGQGSSATSVCFYQPTRCHIPEDGRPNLQTKLKKS